MDFKEYMKIKNQMTGGACNSEFCGFCPLNNGVEINGEKHYMSCGFLEVEYPDKAIEILKKWAEEHKGQTNRDKMIEVFGVEIVDTICMRMPDNVFFTWLDQGYKKPIKSNEKGDNNES